jgi:hypothetical protein
LRGHLRLGAVEQGELLAKATASAPQVQLCFGGVEGGTSTVRSHASILAV